MRRYSIFITAQQKKGEIRFPWFLFYVPSTILVILLSGRHYEPDYQPYLFKIIVAETILALIGGFAGFMIVRFLVFGLSGWYRRLLQISGYTIGAIWAGYHWEMILLYLKRIKTGCPDPILGKDIAFYLFDLPLYENLFMAMFCLVGVSLACLLVRLFVQGDEDYRKWMNWQGRIFQNRYDWIYIHIGLLLFVLALGRYLERYGHLYWQLGPDFNMDSAEGLVLSASAGQIIVAVITGSFFVLFPFIRGRLPILSALQKLLANRHSQANPHFRLIRYVLAASMFMLWQTAPQTTWPPVGQVPAAGFCLPFSEVNETRPLEYQEYCTEITGLPIFFNGFGWGQGQDSLMVNR
jgi:hypothetical protein